MSQQQSAQKSVQKNVLGQPLLPCGLDPVTGFFRDGFCHTCDQDSGIHTVCAVMTEAFLAFSLKQGNDLITPHPEWNFPGLKAGDHWCLCALRWKEAFEAGKAPRVILQSTHEATLEVVNLADLKPFAVDLN
ncbi:DUF2237 family protein [Kistimonas scapharcae]|uniref:DUF2237 family protein n=1 Tax=Kistimonas scapharcae TaxID=1036133 RepID=A0ABP8V7H6_9GAMM